jgi:hypothetical protein
MCDEVFARPECRYRGFSLMKFFEEYQKEGVFDLQTLERIRREAEQSSENLKAYQLKTFYRAESSEPR